MVLVKHYGADMHQPSANERFATQMREQRARKEWSQRRLAEELKSLGMKLDPSAVTRIENGQREPRYSEAVAIAAALQFPISVAVGTSQAHDLATAATIWLDKLGQVTREGEAIVGLSEQLSDDATSEWNGLRELVDALPRFESSIEMRPDGSTSVDIRVVDPSNEVRNDNAAE